MELRRSITFFIEISSVLIASIITIAILVSSTTFQALVTKCFENLYLLVTPGVSINSIYTPLVKSVCTPLISFVVVLLLFDTALTG